MRFVFIDAEKAIFPVAVLCRVLQVSTSGFYAWKRQDPSKHSLRDQQLAVKIAAFHAESDGTYGSPRIHDDLREDGEKLGRKRVARLMQAQGLSGNAPKQFRRTTNSSHSQPVAINLVQRNFDVEAPNKVWAADITYVRTWEGWMYLAVILDLYSRRVVGWAIDDHMRTELALEALSMAFEQRQPPPGLIHHSDRGSQYASTEYRSHLASNGALSSMSRKGDCWDNAVAESFFGSLKREHVERQSMRTKRQTRKGIVGYIECFYNSRRRHSYIDNTSPIKYEARALAAKQPVH
jgi:transposase InsO family protein